MRRRQDQLERLQFLGRHVHAALERNVGLDPVDHPKRSVPGAIETLDLRALPPRVRHAHPARNAQTVGVIADADIFVAFLARAGGHLPDGMRAVAGGGVRVKLAPDILHGDEGGQLVLRRQLDFIVSLA